MFALKVLSNSTLASIGIRLPDFPFSINFLLSDMLITQSRIVSISPNMDSLKTCVFVGIPVLKLYEKYTYKLDFVLSEPFTKCLNTSCFPDYWKSASGIPVDLSFHRTMSILSLF